MLSVFPLFILAFAVSLDGFTVGAMYGLRKIKVPLYAVAIISVCSGLIIYSSMKLGQLALQLLSPYIAQICGAVILMGIGLWAVYQVMTNKERNAELSEQPAVPVVQRVQQKKLLQIEIKRLGLVIQILKKPTKADLDRSGNISASEALLLGFALSLDSFGAGIGAALIGFPPLLTALAIAVASGSFVALGLWIGYRLSHYVWLRKVTVLPGCVLFIMGMIKLF